MSDNYSVVELGLKSISLISKPILFLLQKVASQHFSYISFYASFFWYLFISLSLILYYSFLKNRNHISLFIYFISWRLITLQYCSGFCHTLTWISHGFTCIPHPDPPMFLIIPIFPAAHRFLAVSCVCMLGSVRLSAALWTITRQAPLSIEISQARILEWVTMPSSKGSSLPMPLKYPALAGGFFFFFFANSVTWEAVSYIQLTSRDACCKERIVIVLFKATKAIFYVNIMYPHIFIWKYFSWM